jgi:uncharacterized protein YbjT (DUF2867 family)
MIQRIVVTGGTGFVGQAVCEHLVERSGGAAGRIVVPTRRIRRGQATSARWRACSPAARPWCTW